MAALEGGVGALAVGSGQAAQLLVFMSLCEAGDEIVAASTLYGGTYTQLDISLRRLGIKTTFVVMDACVKIEHARFFGGLNTIGLNTGVISARRLPR